MIRSLAGLTKVVSALPLMRAVFVMPHNEDLQFAFDRVDRDLIAHPIYVGDLEQAGELSAEECEMEHYPDEKEACQRAVEMVVAGEADILVKGMVNTSVLLRAVLNSSLRRKGKMMTHVAVIENPNVGQPVFAADGGMTPDPLFGDYEPIIQHTVDAVHAFGRSEAKIALVAANEKVTEHIPFTGIAARIVEEMTFEDALLHGPIALDTALQLVSAQKKNDYHPVAGHADGIIGGSIDTVNGWVKALSLGENHGWGGVVLGAEKPIALDSRGNYDPMTTVHSIAFARLMVDFYAR